MPPLFVGLRDRKKAAELRRHLTADLPTATETFSPSMAEGLPAPARRYLEHAIAPGTPLGHALELDFVGYLQSGREAPKLALSGSNVLVVPTHGFLWTERFSYLGVPRHGLLYYLQDKGEVLWSYAGLIGVRGKRRQSPDTAKSMRTRIMSHLIWTPWAFLPCRGARWEALDDDSAKVFVKLDGVELEMEIHVDENGRLMKAIHPRWGSKNPDRSYGFFPFGLIPQGEDTFDGYTLPTPLDLEWCHGMPNRKPPLLYRHSLKRVDFR